MVDGSNPHRRWPGVNPDIILFSFTDLRSMEGWVGLAARADLLVWPPREIDPGSLAWKLNVLPTMLQLQNLKFKNWWNQGSYNFTEIYFWNRFASVVSFQVSERLKLFETLQISGGWYNTECKSDKMLLTAARFFIFCSFFLAIVEIFRCHQFNLICVSITNQGFLKI